MSELCRLCQNEDGTLGECKGHELLDCINKLEINNSVQHQNIRAAQQLIEELQKEIRELRSAYQDDLK